MDTPPTADVQTVVSSTCGESWSVAGGRIVSSFFTVVTYLFFKWLIWWPQYHPGTRKLVDEENARPRLPERVHNTRVIRFFVDHYRNSYFYLVIHRRGRNCCYIPSCTDYAVRAVEKYGYVVGLRLASGRFRRCSPEYPHDYLDFP
jgi:putative component of membrane protein insertase Oxa1/YidC/SpoIIIJ protein YidD